MGPVVGRGMPADNTNSVLGEKILERMFIPSSGGTYNLITNLHSTKKLF